MDSTATLGQKIDALIFDTFAKSLDIIVQGRRWQLDGAAASSSSSSSASSAASSSSTMADVAAVLPFWRENPSRPLQIDVRLQSPDTSHVLLSERWLFVYRKHSDAKDGGRLSAVNRRVVTFLRSLYCFVRLLPGFQLLTLTAAPAIVSYRVYCPDAEAPPFGDFPAASESAAYEFPRIPTFRGALCVGVRYAGVGALQVRPLLILLVGLG